MSKLDFQVIRTLARRTFLQAVESPVAYILGLFFYGFVGSLFGVDFFLNSQGSIAPISTLAPWVLWIVVPAMTMGLISDEIRSGTFEQLSTLPVRDTEIVLGKYLGFAALAAFLTAGLAFYAVFVRLVTAHPTGIDLGATIGVLAGIYFLMLTYGAMGLYASSLAKHLVVVWILGMIFCTFFFFIGQFTQYFPSFLSPLGDFIGVTSHVATIARGVWDIRDLLYFGSLIGFFLYLTILRLNSRKF